MGRVLIHIALLSTASGWQLPSNDEEAAHAPMITGGVSGARDRRRLASDCDSDCNDSCDDGCTNSCDGCCDNFFGWGSCDCECDDTCSKGCDVNCDGSCDAGCRACSSGKYGAAEQVTCGPRAVAQPPNTHLTPVTVPPPPPVAYPRRRHPRGVQQRWCTVHLVQRQWCSAERVLCVHQQAGELILHGWLNRHERMPVQVQPRVLPHRQQLHCLHHL